MYFDPVLWSCKLQQKQKMKKFITQNCVRAESHLIGILSHFGHLQSAKEHHLSFKVKLLAKRRSAFAKRLLFQSICSHEMALTLAISKRSMKYFLPPLLTQNVR